MKNHIPNIIRLREGNPKALPATISYKCGHVETTRKLNTSVKEGLCAKCQKVVASEVTIFRAIRGEES